MTTTVVDPNAVYDRAGLQKALNITSNTVTREVRLGRLKACFRAKRYYFIGADVLDWLRGGQGIPVTSRDDDEDGRL